MNKPVSLDDVLNKLLAELIKGNVLPADIDKDALKLQLVSVLSDLFKDRNPNEFQNKLTDKEFQQNLSMTMVLIATLQPSLKNQLQNDPQKMKQIYNKIANLILHPYKVSLEMKKENLRTIFRLMNELKPTPLSAKEIEELVENAVKDVPQKSFELVASAVLYEDALTSALIGLFGEDPRFPDRIDSVVQLRHGNASGVVKQGAGPSTSDDMSAGVDINDGTTLVNPFGDANGKEALTRGNIIGMGGSVMNTVLSIIDTAFQSSSHEWEHHIKPHNPLDTKPHPD